MDFFYHLSFATAGTALIRLEATLLLVVATDVVPGSTHDTSQTCIVFLRDRGRSDKGMASLLIALDKWERLQVVFVLENQYV